MIVGCNDQDLIEVKLKVHLESGVTGYSHEGNRVQISGDFIQIESIDAEGNAYFEFEAEKGERLYVMFLEDDRNFNPQGMAAYDWSPVLTSDVHAKDFFVGDDPYVQLMAIPATKIDIAVRNEVIEDGDSLQLRIFHELYTTGGDVGDETGFSLNFSGPIGSYRYEGTNYKATDTSFISGTFEVLQENPFRIEIPF